jgi:hypothetical protein
MTTPPVPEPTPTPTPEPSESVISSLEETLGAFIDAHLHTAIVNAVTELLGAEGKLMLPFTAWINGWLTQLRTDYSPGGVLAESMKEATRNFHLLAREEDL